MVPLLSAVMVNMASPRSACLPRSTIEDPSDERVRDSDIKRLKNEPKQRSPQRLFQLKQQCFTERASSTIRGNHVY